MSTAAEGNGDTHPSMVTTKSERAMLVVVATPIGNLADLSPRATEALAAADLIACEDTRRVRKLLTHAGLRAKKLLAVPVHREAAEVGTILSHLDQGRQVALVTDAGTPGISDPGQRIVEAAVDAGHDVLAVPGPSAALAALVVSGLPTRRFVFEGFLPRKGRDRADRLAVLAAEARTAVLYEAPNRVRQTVEDLCAACGPSRRVVLARELTKLHEEVWRGTLGEAADHLAALKPRGEHVVVLEGSSGEVEANDEEIETALLARLEAGEDKRAALPAVAAQLHVPKRRVYDVALRLDRG